MYILGIETSCDDTAAAVIEATPPLSGCRSRAGFRVLSNISYSQVAIHKKFGGIVPNLASRAHLEKIAPTVKSALSAAGISEAETDLIAVTRGPGLIPSLLVGVNFARALAYKWQKPIIGVNHIEGHIYSNWIRKESSMLFASGLRARSGHGGRLWRPSEGESLSATRWGARGKRERAGKILFPALILIVSGGHTELVLMRDYGKYKIIGETLDDAAGEAFDKTARLLGLGFPGGPAVAALADKFSAEGGSAFGGKIVLPRPMINSKDYNFSFSGLKTAVLYLYNDLIKKYPPKEIVPIMAYEVQNAIIDILIAKALRAVKNFQPKIVMIAGGVAANKKLREEMSLKIAKYKIPFLVPDLAHATDNAAMIAAAGYFSCLRKKCEPDSWKKISADANLRL